MLNPSSSSRYSAAVRVLLCIVCAAMVCSAAFAQGPLNFYKNYFVTGDYAVSGVALRGMGDGSGFATNTIPLPTNNRVPAGADIVAAFLYWQTVEKDQSSHAGENGFFNLHAISGTVLGNNNAPVSWSAGGCAGSSNGTTTLRTYRADVRPFLSTDADGVSQWNGGYTVRLADSGSNGGGTPLTLGATLVVVFRVLGKTSPYPLNAITIYDGTFAPSNSSQSMTLGIQGFYEAASDTASVASLTEIVGNGQSNKGELIYFNNAQLQVPGGNFPFAGPWDTLRVPVTVPAGYVDENTPIQTSVVPTATNSGCVSWGAVILATTVQSKDNDGLIDIWKTNQGYPDYSTPGNDPVSLPGAVLGEQDLFVQIDWFASHDYITSGGTQGHTHMPKKAAIDMVGDAFLHSPFQIHLHIDCGGCYPPPPGAAADPYIISGGSGGNVIDESNVVCQDQPANSPPIYCGFPGVVATSWKGGFETLKNHQEDPVPLGTPPPPPRFQHGRKDSYHYVLFGHALGLAANVWAISNGTLTSIVVNNNQQTATVTTSTPHGLVTGARVRISGAVSPVPVSQQDFALNGTYPSITVTSDTTFTFSLLTLVPVGTYANPGMFVSSGPALSTSGWSDFAGADSLITLGLWRSDNPGDDQVGSALVQAGTLMHELGHTLGLQHGGSDGVNCKSNFESVMNYLFQVRGLTGFDGNVSVDFSDRQLGDLSEGGLNEQLGVGVGRYQTMWYEPFNPLDVVINSVGGHAASRHCDGTPITNDAQMVRVLQPLSPINPSFPTGLDWNGDGAIDAVNPPGQDINFSGAIDAAPFHGANEWTDILDLRQIGARKGVFGFSTGVWGTLDVGAGGTLEVGAGGTLDVGAGGTLDVGAGGTLDNGAGGTLDVGAGGQESNFDEANTTVDPPGSLTFKTTKKSVILSWSAPGFGQIRTYFIWRAVVKPGVPVLPTSFVNIGSVSSANKSPLTTFTDTNVKNNTTYRYFVTAALGSPSPGVPGNQSGASNFVTVPF